MKAVFKPTLVVVAVTVFRVSQVGFHPSTNVHVAHGVELPPEGLQVPDGITVSAGDYVVVQDGHIVLRVTEAEFFDNWFEVRTSSAPVLH